VDRDANDRGPGWGILALLFVPLLCCGGPAIVGLLGASGIGAIWAGFARSWMIGGVLAIIALVTGALVWRRRQRHSLRGAAEGGRLVKNVKPLMAIGLLRHSAEPRAGDAVFSRTIKRTRAGRSVSVTCAASLCTL